VRDVSPFNFGLIVAYIVPGFVVLWGLSYHSETVRQWLTVTADQAPTVGDLLYATLASVAAGVIVSAVRWAVIDTLHHHTGIPPPRWNFAMLPERLEAFRMLVEDHYRYFQFYSNSLVALAFLYVARRTVVGALANQWGVDAGFITVGIVLFIGSRDALRRYYRRAEQLFAYQGEGGEEHDERQRPGPSRRSQDRRAEGAEAHATEAKREPDQEAGSSEVAD
jgi:hypothetical protein